MIFVPSNMVDSSAGVNFDRGGPNGQIHSFGVTPKMLATNGQSCALSEMHRDDIGKGTKNPETRSVSRSFAESSSVLGQQAF
jgi:hypothetical protein